MSITATILSMNVFRLRIAPVELSYVNERYEVEGVRYIADNPFRFRIFFFGFYIYLVLVFWFLMLYI